MSKKSLTRATLNKCWILNVIIEVCRYAAIASEPSQQNVSVRLVTSVWAQMSSGTNQTLLDNDHCNHHQLSSDSRDAWHPTNIE